MSKDLLNKDFSKLSVKEKESKPLTKRKNMFQFIKEKDLYLPLNFIWYSLLDKYKEKHYFDFCENGNCISITYSDLKTAVKVKKISIDFFGKSDNTDIDKPYYNVKDIIELFKELRNNAYKQLDKDWDL